MIGAEDLRHALGHFTTGVTVVTTTSADGEPVGTTASAVSASPPRNTLRWTSRRRGETTRPSAASTPDARGQTISVIPSSRAIAAACRPPAPPNASSA